MSLCLTSFHLLVKINLIDLNFGRRYLSLWTIFDRGLFILVHASLNGIENSFYVKLLVLIVYLDLWSVGEWSFIIISIRLQAILFLLYLALWFLFLWVANNPSYLQSLYILILFSFFIYARFEHCREIISAIQCIPWRSFKVLLWLVNSSFLTQKFLLFLVWWTLFVFCFNFTFEMMKLVIIFGDSF